MNNILFVIPARSGSKGIKNKNIRKCANETLLRRSVKICNDLNYLSNIYVSTDSQKYLDHVSDLIDNAPILRPDYLSGDLVGDIEVLTHAFHSCEKFYKTNYECIVMIQPTCPLRKKEHIVKSIEAILLDNFDSAVTCQKVDKKYHPLKSLILNQSNQLSHYFNNQEEIIARQQLRDTFIRNGASYAITPHQLCEGKTFFKGNSKLILTDQLMSIDTIDELKLCEKILLKNINE